VGVTTISCANQEWCKSLKMKIAFIYALAAICTRICKSMANGGEQSTIDRNFSSSRAQFGLAEVARVPAELPSWHSTDKAAAILLLYKAQAHAHMPTTGPRARKIFRNFIESNVTVNYFEQKLHGTLQPHMQAPHTGCLDDDAVI